MGSKLQEKNIFESGFDSFEFDDGFFVKVDSDLKKYKNSEKQYVTKKVNCKTEIKQDCIQEEKEKKLLDKKKQYYDLPLFIEDVDESDFFDLTQNKNKKSIKNSTKVSNVQKSDKANRTSVDKFMSCLSPIQGSKSANMMNLSSSTPVRSIRSDSNSAEKQKLNENSAKVFDYAYLEADLFDDWDVNEIKNGGASKETVTLSQALKLIEEAESARESDQRESLNQSVDLLTGEVVTSDIGVMFDESFGIPESGGKKQEDAESSSDSVIIVSASKAVPKPQAAQKLNFESDKVNPSNFSVDKKNNFRDICFNSDDDFDFLSQDLLEKPKEKKNPVSESARFNSSKDLSNSNRTIPLNDCDLNESSEAVVGFKKKRGKCFNIIESDSTEDSPSPKFHRQIKAKMGMQKNLQENFRKEFIDSEAEVSDEVSSDETEEDGEYDKSFVDEESYFTQNCSANMTTKYLESVNAISLPGSFKIPAPKPYNPDNIFSQIPEENNTDYEIDSFCVNEVEETKTELSDLEIAEEILEMDRRKKKRKRFEKLRKLK